MDFAFSESQAAWRDATLQFVRDELALDLDLPGRDERREFWLEGWRRCARFGLQGLPIPKEVWRPGAGLARDDRRDGRLGLRLSRQWPDLRPERLTLDRGHPSPLARDQRPETALLARTLRRLPHWCQRSERARGRFGYLRDARQGRSVRPKAAGLSTAGKPG